MIIRVKKGKILKPRFCVDCGKFVIIARHPLQERCKTCKNRKHNKLRGHGKKYRSGYWRKRKKLLERIPYCQLCGTGENLTAHHVGGAMIIISSPSSARNVINHTRLIV